MDEVPIFERLTDGWFNDDIGLFFLLEKVAECGNITRLGAGLTKVVWRRTGTRLQVIERLSRNAYGRM